MYATTLLRLPALLCCIAVLGGCAAGSYSDDRQLHSSVSRSQRPAPVQDIRPAPARPQPDSMLPTDEQRPSQPARPSSNRAAASLLQQAAEARSSGDYDRAQTLAERAQGLAPRDARSYLELARIYRDRGDTARSRQMALRGLSVADGDPSVEYELRLLSAP